MCMSYVILYSMVVNFFRDQIFMDFIRFLSHDILYTVFKVFYYL